MSVTLGVQARPSYSTTGIQHGSRNSGDEHLVSDDNTLGSPWKTKNVTSTNASPKNIVNLVYQLDLASVNGQ